MDPAIVSAMAAVFGSLVGGSATVATAWITQKTLSKRELISAEIPRAKRSTGSSFANAPDSSWTRLRIHWTSRRRCCPCMSCSIAFGFPRPTLFLRRRNEMLKRITEQYFSPNLSVEEMRTLVRSGSGADPLKSFGEACRVELKSMRAAV